MEMQMDLTGLTFKTTIYESVVGKIEIENEILTDGSISTTLWVVFPDGVGDEIATVQEGFDKLEL
jgi:hypothetical protein